VTPEVFAAANLPDMWHISEWYESRYRQSYEFRLHGYIGIDYSGVATPTSSLKSLRVFEGDPLNESQEVLPLPSPRRYWTRQGIAEWLVAWLSAGSPSLVGIDHAFSFPIRYFEKHNLPLDWEVFLDDFQRRWPTDEAHTYVDFIRNGLCGNADARSGHAHWRRVTGLRSRTAKSVFHFDVPGSVAKATHAGLPWLRYLRMKLGSRVHFRPFDGWRVQPGSTVIAEVYPALWNRIFYREGRTSDQHEAYTIAEWFRCADEDGSLKKFFTPELALHEFKVAEIEGWILGVI
jgi:transcriptional regulator with XRE-family HTH domain